MLHSYWHTIVKGRSTTALVLQVFPRVSCMGLGRVSTGDVHALQELTGCASAYRESDSRGRLPLHAAAVQPQRGVLHVVLQGENRLGVQPTKTASSICNFMRPLMQMWNTWRCKVPVTLTYSYWCFCSGVGVHRADPGGADRGRGHVPDPGSRGRPGG